MPLLARACRLTLRFFDGIHGSVSTPPCYPRHHAPAWRRHSWRPRYHRNVLAILFVITARLLTRITAGDKSLGLGSTAEGGDRMSRPMVQVFAATAVVSGSDITTSITLAT